jgi:hypothetical protein
MSLVQIAAYSTRVEADLARLLLDEEGIEAVLFDTEMNYFLGPMMGVRLMVLKEDADTAIRLLADKEML